MSDYAETRDRRSIFGMIAAVIFWVWHVLMGFVFVTAVISLFAVEVGAAGAGFEMVGGGLGLFMILLFWVLGTAILLIPFMLTRGKKRWVEE